MIIVSTNSTCDARAAEPSVTYWETREVNWPCGNGVDALVTSRLTAGTNGLL